MLSAVPLITVLLSMIFCCQVVSAYYGWTSKKDGRRLKCMRTIRFMKDVGDLAKYHGPLRIRERISEAELSIDVGEEVKASTEMTSYGINEEGTDNNLEVSIVEEK
jgi:hypothetical protein